MDDDLALIRDFPLVQCLMLSETMVTDNALSYLDNLPDLTELIIVDTQISDAAIADFKAKHPSVTVTTEPPDPNMINPFTGEPFNS